MNSKHENELAAQIDRELKSLPPLPAPASLAPRVMAAITATQRAPATRAGWQSWPLTWRVASFTALVALFAGLCFGGWQATQTEAMSTATARVNGAFSLLELAGKTLGVLGEALLAVVRHVGTGYVIGGLVVVGLAYAACAAAGSYYFRFAFARR